YGYSSVGRFDVFFRNQLLVFQQHQDESLCDSHIINLTAERDLMKFSDIGAWYAIEDCAQYDKKCSNPTNAISDETIANPNAHIVRDDMVRVQVPRCMAWSNYNEHVDSLSTMDSEVGVTSPESTIQTLPSFEEYTPPVTYLKEVEKTLGTPIEVEPLDETQLEDLGLNTCNHDILLVLREESGSEPLIKPHSPDSFRMKVVDNLTIHTSSSPHVASFHLKDVYCYYRQCIDDPKIHYGFKPEQYNSLSDLEKEHTKSVYLRNEEDKRRGVEYVMSKILGFYKECLELGPEYVTGMDDEGEVT
ncbi:hypothetical protein Tco_0929586, partial [Tanacetum coccineum]